MTNKEILLTVGILALLSWNAYTWYNGGNKTPQGGFNSPDSMSKPTTTVKCPEGGIQALDPNNLQLFTDAKQKKTITKIVEKIIYKDVIKKEYPSWFDPNKTALLADKKIPAWKGETYVISTLDLQTGVGGITYKQLPIPLFGYENETRIGLGYVLVGTDSGKYILTASYTPIRMGKFYITGFGQAIGDRTNLGGQIEYRW